jgi:protoheme IX farnesyltransferase
VKAAPDTLTAPTPGFIRGRTADFLELTKPRITVLVVATTLLGFYIGTHAVIPILLLIHTLLGTALVASGASAFNMYLERHLDALMVRTERRPLPAGRLQSGEALIFAVLISSTGMVYLFAFVNPLTSLLSALTFVSYLFLYTPLKTRTWLCTLIGAVPGALPVAMGWAAGSGRLSLGAWVLFSIVFFWQLPHFYAIGWMYREDYARAGFPMLPIIDLSGTRTSRQVNLYIVALIIVTVLPSLMHLAGYAYLCGAIALGFLFLAYGTVFSRLRDHGSARRLFLVSVCYLPILLALMAIDKVRG